MDIYFLPEYGKLCEKIEGGGSEIFEYQCDFGIVRNMYIKRPIPWPIDGVQYYDIITPYGYGGPVVLTTKEGKREELCRGFDAAFERHCYENGIVSEFVRFHPIFRNADDFSETYHPICIRKTLGTNLEDYDDPVRSEFSKHSRKNIGQALKAGITYRITEAPENLSGFQEIYYSTIERRNAAEFYYFGDEFFENILKYFRKNVFLIEAIYESKTIASVLCFASDNIIYSHLSGTLSEYLNLSPACILKYAGVLWGKKHGFRLIYYGGGLSNDPNDSLFFFKKKFAQNTEFEFYVAKRVRMKDVYAQLCRFRDIQEEGGFFPAYRAG